MVSADGNIGLTRVEQLTALISTLTKGQILKQKMEEETFVQ